MIEGRGLGARLIGAARNQAMTTVMLSAAQFVAQVGVARRSGFVGLGDYVATGLAIYVVSVAAMLAIPLTAGRQLGYLLERDETDAASDTASAGLLIILFLATAGGVLLASLWGWLGATFVIVPASAYVVALAVISSAVMAYSIRLLQARLQVAAAGLVAIAQPFVVVLAIGWDTISPGVHPSDMAVFGYIAGGIVGAASLLVAGIVPRWDRAAVLALLRKAIPYAPASYANHLAGWVDRIVVSVVLGAPSLGTYQAATALVEGPLRLLRGASFFFVSAYGRAVAVGDQPGARLRRVHVRIWSAYAAAIAGGLLASADGLVTSLYGPGFSGAILPLSVLALGLIPTTVGLTLLTAGVGMEHQSALVIARLAIPAQLALGLVLAQVAGVPGVALAQVAVLTPIAIAQMHWSRDPSLVLPGDLALRLIAVMLLVPLAGAVLALAPVWWPLRLGIGIAVGAAIGARLLLESEERYVVRRLLAFR